MAQNEKTNELNGRQWALYRFIKENGNNWMKLKDIASYLTEYYGTFKGNWNNSKVRRTITRDIDVIERSGVIQKVIIKGYKGIKLAANEEEAIKYLKNYKFESLKSLKKYWIAINKVSLDGQYRLVSGKERDVIEAFIKEGEND